MLILLFHMQFAWQGMSLLQGGLMVCMNLCHSLLMQDSSTRQTYRAFKSLIPIKKKKKKKLVSQNFVSQIGNYCHICGHLILQMCQCEIYNLVVT